MNIIDFHTHAFPDAVAERAIAQLEGENHIIKAVLDGKVSTLLASMDQHGIAQSVVCSIATKPDHYGPILQWSQSIASERLIPFPSIHPADPMGVERVWEIKRAGFLGIKFHPYYQEFAIDEERMWPIYEAIEAAGLIVLVHGGFDLSFPFDRIADPIRSLRLVERFPKLKYVAAHMGAWGDWDEVRKHLLGQPIYMDISFLIEIMPREEAREMLLAHPKDYILFGTDSPWVDHGEAVARLLALDLGQELNERILHQNARRLLDSVN